ncbi:MAG: antitoxin [Actinomycetota bacterium]|nr:antitoxin [Actinomycetota bacterium]
MGILDKIKSLVSSRQDQLKSGIDKASGVVEDKVGAKHAPKVDQAAEKAKEVVDKIAGTDPVSDKAAGDDLTGDTPTDHTPSTPPANDVSPAATPKDPPVTGV